MHVYQNFEGAIHAGKIRPDEVSDAAALRHILEKRIKNGSNDFWLDHGSLYPSMQILVLHELAWVYFFPNEEHAGFQSLGNLVELPSNGDTTFYMTTPGEELPVQNRFVVRAVDAYKAAEEFMRTHELPKCISWFEL